MGNTSAKVTTARPLVLQIFARYPRPGQVKTRLFPVLGQQAAYTLQLAMLEDLVQRLRLARRVHDIEIWGTECASLKHYKDLLRQSRGRFQRQSEGHLGLRMQYAVNLALVRGKIPVLIGADAPQIDASTIAQIHRRLCAGADAVMIPAYDGGYVALAVRQRYQGFFRGIDWGTSKVAVQTLKAMRRRGLRCDLMEPYFDIDEAADLSALEAAGIQQNNPTTALWLRENQYRWKC